MELFGVVKLFGVIDTINDNDGRSAGRETDKESGTVPKDVFVTNMPQRLQARLMARLGAALAKGRCRVRGRRGVPDRTDMPGQIGPRDPDET